MGTLENLGTFAFPVTEPFTFEWPVDQDGYDVIEKTESGVSEDLIFLSGQLRGIDDRRAVRRRGGPLRFYRPLEEAPALFLELAHLEKSPAAVIEFANRFGLIGYAPPRPADEISEEPLWAWFGMIDALAAAEGLLKRYRAGEVQISDWIDAINSAMNPELIPKLSLPPGKKPRIVAHPRTLADALQLQFMFQITHGRTFKQCDHCSAWFPFGRGTGNRSRKRFCTNKCRVAAHRRRKEAASRN